MTPDLSSSLSLAGPELIVAVGALVLLMLGVYRGERRQPRRRLARRRWCWSSRALWVIYSGGAGRLPSATPSSAIHSPAS